MTITTDKGIPIPEGTDAADGPAAINGVAQWLDDNPGIAQLTYAEINALAGAGLWAGRRVYQTDTGTFRGVQGVYEYNVNWTRPWNTAWGVIGYVENAALTQNIGTTISNVTGMSVTVSVPANRILEVVAAVPLVVQNITNGLIKVHLCDAANINIATVVNDDVVATGRTSGERTRTIFGLSGSLTFKLRGLTTSDSMTVTGNATGDPGPVSIRVSDCGPNGSPT